MDHSNILPPHQIDATSTSLLARLAVQDPEAWRQLVNVYGPVVRYWIHRAGLSSADLADVFQEVFLAVSRNIATFSREAGIAKFRAWLKTITLSKVQDHFRRQVQHPKGAGGTDAALQLGAIASPEAGESVSDSTLTSDAEDERLVVSAALNVVKKEFQENSWKSFWRTAVDGLSATDVAAELGLTSVAVRKAKSRVLARLRELLGDDLTAIGRSGKTAS